MGPLPNAAPGKAQLKESHMKMKQSARWALSSLALAALPLVTLAQAPDGPGPRDCGPAGPHHAHHRPPGPMGEAFAPHGEAPGIPPHLRHLNLTDEQQDKVFNLLHEQVAAQRERMKAARAAHEALMQLTRADRFDAQKARTLADAQAKAMSDMIVARAETQSRIRAILTPEQRQKLDAERARREHGERP
jgi:periplasmic protein CpxP/Spy